MSAVTSVGKRKIDFLGFGFSLRNQLPDDAGVGLQHKPQCHLESVLLTYRCPVELLSCGTPSPASPTPRRRFWNFLLRPLLLPHSAGLFSFDSKQKTMMPVVPTLPPLRSG